MNYLEAFAPEAAKDLPEDVKYQRYLIPAFLSFCLIDTFLYGLYSFFFLKSDSLTAFSVGMSSLFVLLLFLSRRFLTSRPLILSFLFSISAYFILTIFWFEQANLLILLNRYAIYATVGLLLSGRRFLQGFLGLAVFLIFCFLFNYGFDQFTLPLGVSDRDFMEAFLGSIVLSGFLIFALMILYNQSYNFSLDYMEKQKQWHDSNRLTKEFVNLAGDMSSVMKGPLEDVLSALKSIRETRSTLDGPSDIAIIKKASEAVYGIARSFGVLAQNQGESCNVRINLDELVRYAQIVCEAHFNGLGVEMIYKPGVEDLEFEGPSGRWLLLLVGLLQFMAEQINRNGGRCLHLKRHLRDQGWELVLTADGVAPVEFAFDLQQKLKEESTKELLEQTSGKAFLYLLDRWGLKLGSFQPIT